jgi:integrase
MPELGAATYSPRSVSGSRRRREPTRAGRHGAAWCRARNGKTRSTTDFATDGDPIFTTLTGEPLNDHNFKREVVGPAAQRAGVEATPHQLRHTSLSMFYEVQRDQEKTRKRARHADSTTTSKFYVRAVESPEADWR